MRLVFDIETNPIDFTKGDHLRQAHTVWCIYTYDVDTKKEKYWANDDGPFVNELLAECLHYLGNADELIGHNIIEFDVPVLGTLFNFRPKGRLTDTLVLSRLFNPDREGGHSLESWGERFGFPKGKFDDFTKYSEEMLEYCRTDVFITEKIFRLLSNDVPQWGESVELEHRCADIIARQSNHGFYFDQPAANKLLEDVIRQINDIDNDLIGHHHLRVIPGTTVNKPFKISGQLAMATHRAIDSVGLSDSSIAGPFSTFVYDKINLDSDQQLKEYLLEVGWKPDEYTPTGLPKVTTSSLEAFTPIGPKVLLRGQLAHRRGQIEGLLKFVRDDGRISGGANPCGTNTGRMRHRRIVNIPKTNVFLGHEMRSLFTATPGKILVGYDAKQLELRILAHYIGEKSYADRIIAGRKEDDVHTLAARAAESTDRDLGKRINYALIYGARDGKLGEIIGGSRHDGSVLRKRLYKEIPGLETLINQVEKAATRGYLLGLDGRKVFVREGKSSLNALIQSGGAVCMKWIACYLDEHAQHGDKVLDMHDEAQWEMNEDYYETFKQIVNEAFNACTDHFKLKCRLEADVKRGNNWAETH